MKNPDSTPVTDSQYIGCGRSCAALHLITYGTSGVMIGILLTGLAVWLLVPNLMLTVHKSKYASVDETCAALKDSIEEAGWNCPAIHNINESMAQEGITFPHAIRVVELYQPSYAHDVLESNPELFALMHPCTFGVYEDSDGSVYISGMNIGLMSKLFGGHIAETIGNKITADEISILAPVIVE